MCRRQETYRWACRRECAGEKLVIRRAYNTYKAQTPLRKDGKHRDMYMSTRSALEPMGGHYVPPTEGPAEGPSNVAPGSTPCDRAPCCPSHTIFGSSSQAASIRGGVQVRWGESGGTSLRHSECSRRAFPMSFMTLQPKGLAMSQRTATSTRLQAMTLKPRQDWTRGFPPTGSRGDQRYPVQQP